MIFVTGNAAKAAQLEKYLGLRIPHRKLDVPEIQSLDLGEVVEAKTREAYRQLQQPVLVEDASLTFGVLGALPGPLIKWFLEELGCEGLCRLLDGYPDRSAEAAVMFGYFDGQDFQSFRGSRMGSIAVSPRGENGFGWDPVFIPAGHNKTWAEMDAAEQAKTSMRKPALEELRGQGENLASLLERGGATSRK